MKSLTLPFVLAAAVCALLLGVAVPVASECGTPPGPCACSPEQMPTVVLDEDGCRACGCIESQAAPATRGNLVIDPVVKEFQQWEDAEPDSSTGGGVLGTPPQPRLCAGVSPTCQCAEGMQASRRIRADGCVECRCLVATTTASTTTTPAHASSCGGVPTSCTCRQGTVSRPYKTPAGCDSCRCEPEDDLIVGVANPVVEAGGCACAADAGVGPATAWPETPCESLTTLPCIGDSYYGRRERFCTISGSWSAVVSRCAAVTIDDIMETARGERDVAATHDLVIIFQSFVQREARSFDVAYLNMAATIASVFAVDAEAVSKLSQADLRLLLDVYATLDNAVPFSSLLTFRRTHPNAYATLSEMMGAMGLAAANAMGDGLIASSSASLAHRQISKTALAEGRPEAGFGFEPPTSEVWAQLILPEAALRSLVTPGVGLTSVAIAHHRTSRALAPHGSTSAFEHFSVHVSGMRPGTQLDQPLRFVVLQAGGAHRLQDVVCAWWNATVGQGGTWQTEGCALIDTSTELECRCAFLGAVAMLPSDVLGSTGQVHRAQDAELEIPVLCCICIAAVLFLAVIVSQCVHRRFRLDIDLQQNTAVIYQMLSLVIFAGTYVGGQDERLQLGGCLPTLLVEYCCIYVLFLWFIATLKISYGALAMEPMTPSWQVHGVVWPLAAALTAVHALCHTLTDSNRIDKDMQRPCGVEGSQQLAFWCILAAGALTSAVYLHRLVKVERTEPFSDDPLVKEIITWDRELHPSRINLSGAAVFLALLVATFAVMTLAAEATDVLHSRLELAFGILLLACAVWAFIIYVYLQPGSREVWARQLGRKSRSREQRDRDAAPAKFRMPKRKLSDLPQRLIDQAHANLKRSSIGSLSASLKRMGSSKGIDLQWDDTQTLADSSSDGRSIASYSNLGRPAPSDFSASDMGSVYGDGEPIEQIATRVLRHTETPAKPPRRTQGAPYLNTQEGTSQSSAPPSEDRDMTITWSSSKAAALAAAAELAASDVPEDMSQVMYAAQGGEQRRHFQNDADFGEDC